MTFQLLPVLLARFSKVKWVLTHAVLAAVWCRHVNTQLPLHPLSLPLRSWAGWSCPRAPSAAWRNWDHTLLSCVHILSHCSSPWPYSNPVHDWVLILYKYFETYLKKKCLLQTFYDREIYNYYGCLTNCIVFIFC